MSMRVSKGEQHLLQRGLYVSLPINFLLLFKQSELDVLNVIRHNQNIGCRCISVSLIRLYTGLTESTVHIALTSLKDMGVITVENVCKAGTYYKINYSVLVNTVQSLNAELNPVERLRIADRFRGKGRERHSNLISSYTNTMFDTHVNHYDRI